MVFFGPDHILIINLIRLHVKDDATVTIVGHSFEAIGTFDTVTCVETCQNWKTNEQYAGLSTNDSSKKYLPES